MNMEIFQKVKDIDFTEPIFSKICNLRYIKAIYFI